MIDAGNWFRHDSRASRDPRLVELRKNLGFEGVGCFWAIVEALRDASSYRLSRHELELLDFDLQAAGAILRTVDTGLAIGLFRETADGIGCPALERRMIAYAALREKRQAAARAGGNASADARRRQDEATAKQTLTNRQATGNQRSSNSQPTSNQPATEGGRKVGREEGSSQVRSIHADDFREVLGYLNERAGTNFRETAKRTREHVGARLREGYTVDQLKAVVDVKVDQWAADPRMARYLRPETLFGTKCESYLVEAEHTRRDGLEVVRFGTCPHCGAAVDADDEICLACRQPLEVSHAHA